MMDKSFRSQSGSLFELRLLSRGLSFLALITAVLYVRVLITGGLFFDQPGWPIISATILMIGGLLALLALFRWERVGSLSAIAVGISLFLVFLLSRQPMLTTIFYSSPFIVTGLMVLFCRRQARCSA